jgi:hypothetical protein
VALKTLGTTGKSRSFNIEYFIDVDFTLTKNPNPTLFLFFFITAKGWIH